MCESYAEVKHDFLYRGDILADVPFASLDGDSILVPALKPTVERPHVREWERKDLNARERDIPTVVALRRRPGILLTRTCEMDKLAGLTKVFPAAWVAPIRSFSDFDTKEESGIEFAHKVQFGFAGIDGDIDQRQCFRFAVLTPCQEHGVEGGLVSFREMQPVHLRYLVDARKLARAARPTIHSLTERFIKFATQYPEDDIGDNEAANDQPSNTIKHWRSKNETQRTKNAPPRAT